MKISPWNYFSFLMAVSLESTLWVSAQQNAPCPYAKYVTNAVHTACLPANGSCQILKSGVDKNTQALIVGQMNNIRSNVAQGRQLGAGRATLAPASNMRQLNWNDELAAVAQAHSNQCNMGFDCFDCHRVEDYPTGETIYYFFYNSVPPKINWSGAISQWALSSNRLSTVTAKSFNISAFTQMIWATTKDVGCGFTRFRGNPVNEKIIDFFTCLYGPAGNYDDLNIYESGTACTGCSYRSTCCGLSCQSRNVKADYPGLCKYYGQ